MATGRGNTGLVAQVQQLMVATAKHLTAGVNVTFLGAAYTGAEATAKLQQVVTIQAETSAAKAAATAKVASRRVATVAPRAFLAGLVSYVSVPLRNQPH